MNLNEFELEEYSGNISEIVNAMTRQDAERELISEITKQCKENFGIEPKVTRKIAKIAFERNLEEQRQEAEDTFDLTEQIMKKL